MPYNDNGTTLLHDLRSMVNRLSNDSQIDRAFLGEWLESGRLWKQAVHIESQEWKRLDLEDPSLATTGTSRLDIFFDNQSPYRCLWITEGGRCGHESERREQARCHIRRHFGYTPFMCGGKCGNNAWCVFICFRLCID